MLALSSAAGSAPFDAALKRYVDFLVADGALDVEVEIDPDVSLAPDEEIEVFRIVQEGLANARKHAGARHAEVSIIQRGGRRVVRVTRQRLRIRERGRGRRAGAQEHALAGSFDRGRLLTPILTRDRHGDRGRAATDLACRVARGPARAA